MILIKTTPDKKEMLEKLKQYFTADIAEDMMRATDRNGMSAYGRFMVRKPGKQYVLLMLAEEEVIEE